MSETKRTKGPWRRACFQVYGADNSKIAHTGMGQLPPSRSSESEANAAAIVHWENNFEPLQKALNLALCRLSQSEPDDSRAVSNEFVAMAAVFSGDVSAGIMAVIDAALRAEEQHDCPCGRGDKPCPGPNGRPLCASESR